MDFNIALDKDNHTLISGGTTAQSNIIYIPPGKVALLSLYNMMTIVNMKDENGKKVLENKSCLAIKKLSFGRTPDVSKDLVEDLCSNNRSHQALADELLADRRVFSEPVYQNCCEWSLNPANNMALIPVPGFYVLETDDVDQLSTAYVEYAVIDANQASAIPDGFKLGN